MDEQRVQAYLSLIQELLECPSGEENQILNQHLELLDGAFVQVCEQIAEQLQSQGQENNAGFLRNQAQRVGEYLNSQAQPTSNQYLAILVEILKAEIESEGDPKVVYPILAKHQNQLDLNFAETLTQWFQAELDPNDSDKNQDLAWLLCNFANKIQQFPLGSRAHNLEIAIASYQAALEVYTRTAFPEKWAMTQNNLAIAYRNRIVGERAENLEQAIKSYQAALEVRTRNAFPEKWAMTQNNLASAYLDRIKGEKAENIEQAIKACQAALKIRTCAAFRQQWAATQNNLANAYLNRIRGEQAENLELAIEYYQSALEVYTRAAFREQWAATQNNLANAYLNRIRGERAENLELAIEYYQSTLEIYIRNAFTQDWAMTQNNLANAYRDRIRGERAENLELAIEYYQSALKVRTPTAFPEEWAMTQNNLANAYLNRIRGERAENLELAIEYYQSALEIYTRNAFPEKWAGTQNNLANAYRDRIRGERAENLELAIEYYRSALEVYTRSAFPEYWARTQNNLAIAYSNRIRGERAENLEQAIKYYQAALEVYTRAAFPEKWAGTQNNLANAYLNRIRGERAKNLELAIEYYQSALEVYTRNAFPEKWAGTQNNLANAYRDRIRGERAKNLKLAIKCYQAALEVYTRTAFPQDWAMTLHNLGTAYNDPIRGERTKNLEKAIKYYQAALEVYTRTAFPQNHTGTLNNLGLAYQEQSRYYTSDPEKKNTALQNAYITFQEALDTVEFLRVEITSGYEVKRDNKEWNRLYLGMVEVCLELGNDRAAIEYVDRSKARNLVELIATRDAHPQGVIPPETSQRLQYLRNAISEEDRRLKQDPNPDYTHISQMREERQQLEPYKPLHFKQIQKLLDEETAILEWYILPDKFLTFTLMPDPPLTPPSERGEQEADPSEPPFLRGAGGITIWTSSKEDLDQLIDWGNKYRNAYYQAKEPLQVALEALKAAKTEQEQQKAHELLIRAQDIWQNPLAQRLETLAEILHLPEILQNLLKEFPNCKKLILIPHRYLHLFPLHALPIPTEESEVNSLQELFKQGVTYAPNCQLLQQAQTRYRPNFKRLFAVQNPTNNIRFADLEVETIRRLFPNRSSLQKNNATKAKFLAQDLRQTHHLFFSCHAYFNRKSPLDSGLELADDILTLEEIIASLNLSQCSLVTLSACETGQVAIDDTDEYISLSSGFILAGSPSVLVSLWSVDEVSTTLLLIKTYETLQNHPGQLAIALKTAQIWLRDTTVKGFQDWVQECPILKVVEYWQKHLAEIFQNMGQNEKGVNDRPYQSPYHWATFCVVGQGEQKMASDSDKIQAFTDLLSNNLLADYLLDLEELKSKLGDDDEKNAEAIEQWLNTDKRKSILTAYQEQLKSITSINPLLGVTGEKGFGGSKPKPKTPSPSLKELIDNTTKDNTNSPKNSEEKTPQS